MSPSSPVTFAIVGAGQRGAIYANWCHQNPTQGKVLAVAEPRPYRLAKVADQNEVPSNMRFTNWPELAKLGKIADAVVIAVLDKEHAEVVRVFAELGYAILCEKPMATSIDDCLDIVTQVKKNNVILGIGHVLRYSPYNTSVKEVINTGVLGEIINIQHLEPVGREHFAHSYVRGNWRNEATSTFSLMAKSCHDIDIINYYLFDSKKPRAISSFGGLTHFKQSKKPAEAGSATYCVDCAYETKCPYSAKKIYLDPVANGAMKRQDGNDVWAVHTVDGIPDVENVADAISPKPQGLAAIDPATGDGRWGRCVYEAQNDVCDQQVVNIQFEDGVTASFTMIAQTLKICERVTRIHGSKGEIVGDGLSFAVNDFVNNTSTTYTPKVEGGGHGGGDAGIMRAFVEAVQTGDQMKLGVTPDHILASHLMVFAAERSRLDDEVIKYAEFKKQLIG